jgi:hypothetical protein
VNGIYHSQSICGISALLEKGEEFGSLSIKANTVHQPNMTYC